MLTSYEKKLLAYFILQSDEMQVQLMKEAEDNPKTAAALIRAYKWVLANT